MTHKRLVLIEDIGKFGRLVGGKSWEHQQSIPGFIRDVDCLGGVYIKDTGNVGHFFRANEVVSFTEMEFKKDAS